MGKLQISFTFCENVFYENIFEIFYLFLKISVNSVFLLLWLKFLKDLFFGLFISTFYELCGQMRPERPTI